MPTKNILVVGGAGYIGSHMVNALQQQDYKVIVLDNLVTGHADAVHNAKFIFGNIADISLVENIFREYAILAVMHFAAFTQVGESVMDPAKYYLNNVAGTLHLLNIMRKWQVKHFVFSSSAAVYGNPEYSPIDEKHVISPVNPYGHSKAMIEQILQDYAKAYGLQCAILRYFNAAGADTEAKLSERHEPETHLIPLLLQAAQDKHKWVTVYGRDYPTPDKTCIRDYVHVIDICNAHLLALQALLTGSKQCIYNIGTGKGYSVQAVIDIAKEVTQCEIAVRDGERRAGDPAILIADSSRIQKELNWQPLYPDLHTIIEHAWAVSYPRRRESIYKIQD
jgi:UDP-glucose 4-epimerase